MCMCSTSESAYLFVLGRVSVCVWQDKTAAMAEPGLGLSGGDDPAGQQQQEQSDQPLQLSEQQSEQQPGQNPPQRPGGQPPQTLPLLRQQEEPQRQESEQHQDQHQEPDPEQQQEKAPAQDQAPEHHRVVIIGGGVSGLSAASCLVKNDITDFRLLEARGRLGGRVVAITVGEYLPGQWCLGG